MRISALVSWGSLLLAGCGDQAAPTDTDGALSIHSLRHVIHVDDDAGPGGDGSARAPYDNLHDAVAHAQGIAGATVLVRAGVYELGTSLRVQTPIDLRGSNVMERDAQGWPTGIVAPGTETRIVGTASLGAASLLFVGRDDGGVIEGVSIRGFTFDHGPHGLLIGDDITLTKVQDFFLSDNVLTGSASLGAFTIASSGRIVGNYITNVGAGTAIAAGYPGSPADVEFIGNRSVGNAFGGVLLNGSSTGIPEHGDQLEVLVQDNDLSENENFGIRIFVIRRDRGLPGDTQSTGNVRARIQGNRIGGNQIGFTIDAGFPYRRIGSTCDTRTYSGSFEIDLMGNSLSGSSLTPALISFTRSTAALNQATLGAWQYLHGATFRIHDPESALAGAWIDHPEDDPLLGPCPEDSTHEPLENALLYNGSIVPTGRTVP